MRIRAALQRFWMAAPSKAPRQPALASVSVSVSAKRKSDPCERLHCSCDPNSKDAHSWRRAARTRAHFLRRKQLHVRERARVHSPACIYDRANQRGTRIRIAVTIDRDNHHGKFNHIDDAIGMRFATE